MDKNKSDDIAGFIGRDSFIDGTLIGGKFPVVDKVHIVELEDRYGFRGDTKMILRTELLKMWLLNQLIMEKKF